MKGELSKFILPGEVVNKNPKSICNKCPFYDISILPLCLSLIYTKYIKSEYAAKESMKFFLAISNSFS